MAIGTAFLYNVDEFKIYSTYCANHSKAQKALHQSKSSNYGKRVCIAHTYIGKFENVAKDTFGGTLWEGVLDLGGDDFLMWEGDNFLKQILRGE